MRIGCCSSVENASLLEEIGFDFVELSVQALEPLGPPDALRRLEALFGGLSIKPEAFNGFLPGELKLTGPAADLAALDRYVTIAFERVAALGGEVVVFGSGGSRNIPEGFPRDEGIRQIDAFLKMAGERADRRKITLAIEPLRTAESNIINSVAEGAEFAARADHPRVTVLADFYHMDEESEPLSNVGLPQRLTHVHLADTGRKAPGTGSYDYSGFAAALELAGYSGRVSCECGWGDLATEGPAALTFLRERFPA